MREVRVDLGDRGYAVYIGRGSLGEIGGIALRHGLPKRAGLFTNPELVDPYAERVLNSLRDAGFDPWLCLIPSGDEHKSLEEASRIYGEMLENRMDRKSAVIALGGGMVGDLAGFVAATYMRGIPFVQVPTTLLAQVDASIGGKVAVNHPKAKNLIGAFHQPRFVLIDPETLKTLPERDLKAGMAEVIKHGLIMDRELFEMVESELEGILSLDMPLLEEVIARSCADKARVVERDEKESGLRAILNYGHTVGHAIEAATGYERFRHGEAVSIGMVCAGRISLRRGMMTEGEFARMRELLERTGLPVDFPDDLDPHLVLKLIRHDKKVKAGRLNFILLEGIGRARIVDDVSEEEILESMRG
ncbi:3-dehydroquinate synthase [Candidatus Poribacteria bacterium]|nr:MAG: 3-dehydroquinate synthase [Candidatus Poribacteria bacterium]